MPTTEPRRGPEDLARRGNAIFDARVRDSLRPEDEGKFVAVDVTTGDFEVDDDDFAAVARLRARKASADIWLTRAGQSAAYRMGRGK